MLKLGQQPAPAHALGLPLALCMLVYPTILTALLPASRTTALQILHHLPVTHLSSKQQVNHAELSVPNIKLSRLQQKYLSGSWITVALNSQHQCMW